MNTIKDFFWGKKTFITFSLLVVYKYRIKLTHFQAPSIYFIYWSKYMDCKVAVKLFTIVSRVVSFINICWFLSLYVIKPDEACFLACKLGSHVSVLLTANIWISWMTAACYETACATQTGLDSLQAPNSMICVELTTHSMSQFGVAWRHIKNVINRECYSFNPSHLFCAVSHFCQFMVLQGRHLMTR